jgi:SAM-dependent methyltransferase
MACIEQFAPKWRSLEIHESSPGFRHGYRGASSRLKQEAEHYSTSQYDTSMKMGAINPAYGYRAENLESLTLPNSSCDLFLTQDVFEHIFHPDKAIAEIARVLKPGGAYMMSVPIQNKLSPSRRRAIINDSTGEITHLSKPVYHGGSLDGEASRSLVTVDWGYDILDYLSFHSRLPVSMIYIDDVTRGIRAEMVDIIMMRKPSGPYLDL